MSIPSEFSPSECGPDPQCQVAQVSHWIDGDNFLWTDIADLSDHCPVISLQTLEIRLCQWPSLAGMEHSAPHTRAVHTATYFEREVV